MLRLGLTAEPLGDGRALGRSQGSVKPVVAESHPCDVVAGHEVDEALVGGPVRPGGNAEQLGLGDRQQVVATGQKPGEGQLGDEVPLVPCVVQRDLACRHADHPGMSCS